MILHSEWKLPNVHSYIGGGGACIIIRGGSRNSWTGVQGHWKGMQVGRNFQTDKHKTPLNGGGVQPPTPSRSAIDYRPILASYWPIASPVTACWTYLIQIVWIILLLTGVGRHYRNLLRFANTYLGDLSTSSIAKMATASSTLVGLFHGDLENLLGDLPRYLLAYNKIYADTIQLLQIYLGDTKVKYRTNDLYYRHEVTLYLWSNYSLSWLAIN